MNIFLNGKQQQTSATTLAELIASLSLPAAGVAAAVESKLVNMKYLMLTMKLNLKFQEFCPV